MNKDNFEGAVRSTIGKGEQLAGDAFKDRSTSAQGVYDQVAGKAQQAYGSARDAVASGMDAASSAASSIDLGGLSDEIARLTQTVSDLVQKQASMTRDQVLGAMGSASDNLQQSAAAAQDRLMSMEEDVGSRIRKNPWSAVAIAALVGLLVGKMS
jgi:ElaB/YqjD/DUF883 family membrane-anchored ribosome-binding protein